MAWTEVRHEGGDASRYFGLRSIWYIRARQFMLAGTIQTLEMTMIDNKDAPETLADETLDAISGGPNRQAHDHVGNFNVRGEGLTGSGDKRSSGKSGIIASSGGGDSGI